jgi:outer membrane immunogenic protein
MARQLSVLLLAPVLGLLGTNSWADGMPSRIRQDGVRACSSGPFAGAYIGAAVGYAKQRVEIDADAGGSFHDSDGSVTFGGYTGYNWQCDRFLFGIETDFNYINASPSASVDTITLESSLDWYGTLRGRAGFLSHENLLIYATGGLAYAKVDHVLSDSNVLGAFGPFAQSNGNTTTGWTLGGGAEYLHDSRWILRAEGFYVDLGSESHTYEFTGCGVACEANLNWDDNFWVARLGLTYKFGGREPVTPLK